MKESRLTKVIIILVCVVAVIAVTIIKIVEKEDSKEKVKETTSVVTEEPEKTKIPEDMDETSEEELDINDYLDPNQLENIDTSGYEEDASDGPIVTPEPLDVNIEGKEHLKPKTVEFVYFDEESYDVLNALSINTNQLLLDKIYLYIDVNIYFEVGQYVDSPGLMSVIADSFKLNKNTGICKFTVDLHNDYLIYVTLNANKGTFDFGDNGGYN